MLARDRHPRGAHRPPGPRGQLLAVRARRARAGPCSELYLDRGPDFGADSERPGDDTERYLEYWNLVFMQYELHSDGSLTELPQQNIDTGLGLDRMAAIQQDVPSVYETEHFRPLVEFGERRSGRRYGQDEQTTRSLRVLADHGRGAAFLMADGVVPSNEERGYVLRRILRRAIRHGRSLGIEGPFVPDLCEVVVETMGDVYPELRAERETIARWAAAEEEGFGRTLTQGERLLAELIERARASGAQRGGRRGRLSPPRHLRLPVRDDPGGAGRGGPDRGRPGLRGPDGAGARPRPQRRPRHRRRPRRPSARRPSPARPASPRASWAMSPPRRTPSPARWHPRTARSWSSSRTAPSTRPEAARCPTPAWSAPARRRRGWPRCSAWATTRCWRWSPVAAWRRARRSTRRSTAPRGWPRCATTPPPTCSTRRCASAWETTSARPAPTWARTSCGSTSPTASASPRRSWRTWSSG